MIGHVGWLCVDRSCSPVFRIFLNAVPHFRNFLVVCALGDVGLVNSVDGIIRGNGSCRFIRTAAGGGWFSGSLAVA